jgi:hypothetical protein
VCAHYSPLKPTFSSTWTLGSPSKTTAHSHHLFPGWPCRIWNQEYWFPCPLASGRFPREGQVCKSYSVEYSPGQDCNRGKQRVAPRRYLDRLLLPILQQSHQLFIRGSPTKGRVHCWHCQASTTQVWWQWKPDPSTGHPRTSSTIRTHELHDAEWAPWCNWDTVLGRTRWRLWIAFALLMVYPSQSRLSK